MKSDQRKENFWLKLLHDTGEPNLWNQYLKIIYGQYINPLHPDGIADSWSSFENQSTVLMKEDKELIASFG